MTDYLKIPEVARRLDVSEPTVRRMVKGGKLPSVFIGGAYRVSEEDLATYLESAKVQPGKAPAPPSQRSLFNGFEEERRLGLGSLRAWRAFTGNLWLQWSEEPPAASILNRAVLAAMKDLVAQGAFDTTGVTDKAFLGEITQFRQNLRKLNEIADGVEQDEAAEERRRVFKLIENQGAA